MKKIGNNKKGVSEIVGVAILLGMAIALFTIVQLMAISFPFNKPNPSVSLTATIDDTKININKTARLFAYVIAKGDYKHMQRHYNGYICNSKCYKCKYCFRNKKSNVVFTRH